MRLIKKYQDWVLLLIALVLLVALTAFYVVGFGALIRNWNKAIAPPSESSQSVDLRLESAKQLLESRNSVP